MKGFVDLGSSRTVPKAGNVYRALAEDGRYAYLRVLRHDAKLTAESKSASFVIEFSSVRSPAKDFAPAFSPEDRADIPVMASRKAVVCSYLERVPDISRPSEERLLVFRDSDGAWARDVKGRILKEIPPGAEVAVCGLLTNTGVLSRLARVAGVDSEA